VGFAGSTGDFTELNQIKSWNFATIDDDITTGRRHGRKVLLPLVAFILFAMSSFLVFLVWRRSTRKRRLAYRNLEKMIDAHGPVKFKLKELRRATANFSSSRKLGRGGFGTVYHGYLSSMNMEVAVKRVAANNKSSSNRGEQEFVAEVNTISKLSHRNLVKLIGWCHEGGELLLVYEYFPMGSLDKLLYGGARPAELTWERRYKIICGVASALEYLHHGSSSRILHRDVKASNVMLDEEYSARLGDFGLARAIETDKTSYMEEAGGGVHGTVGYIAPECFHTEKATRESDVYAFGAVVLEVVCGRRPRCDIDGFCFLVDWVWRLHRDGRVLDAVDPRLDGAFDAGDAERLLLLGLACSHPTPAERPKTMAITQILLRSTPPPEVPPFKPAFVWPAIDGGIDTTTSTASSHVSTNMTSTSTWSGNFMRGSRSHAPPTPEQDASDSVV
jgi:serine/threonine protein kinase